VDYEGQKSLERRARPLSGYLHCPTALAALHKGSRADGGVRTQGCSRGRGSEGEHDGSGGGGGEDDSKGNGGKDDTCSLVAILLRRL
jgi:hypothetical protein